MWFINPSSCWEFMGFNKCLNMGDKALGQWKLNLKLSLLEHGMGIKKVLIKEFLNQKFRAGNWQEEGLRQKY